MSNYSADVIVMLYSTYNRRHYDKNAIWKQKKITTNEKMFLRKKTHTLRFKDHTKIHQMKYEIHTGRRHMLNYLINTLVS